MELSPSTPTANPRLPSVFLSHGSPMLALADDEYTRALREYFARLPRPRAIVAISSATNSEAGVVGICAARKPGLVHDFVGFPSELYQLDYACPGSPELAVRIAGLVSEIGGFRVDLNTGLRMDHGVWMPLRLIYPEADIPVVQITLPFPTEPQWVLKLGKALAPLRGEDVLLMASGGVVYNPGKLVWYHKEGPAADWAQEFQDWVSTRLIAKNVEELCAFEDEAPHVALAQPTPRHFFPLFFTVGSAWSGDDARPIFEGIQYTSLSMLSFALS